jgi:hypothetical protein
LAQDDAVLRRDTAGGEAVTEFLLLVGTDVDVPGGLDGTPALLEHGLVTNDYVTGETVSIDGGLTMRIA